MKNIKIYILSIIISYLGNCYFFSTFDISKFTILSKVLTFIVVLLVIIIKEIIEDENYKELQKLKNN